MTTGDQYTLSGEAVPVRKAPTPSVQVRERIRGILKYDKAARDHKMRLFFLYWRKWDGLEKAVGNINSFWQWWAYEATPAKTLDERWREVVRDHPDLGPSPYEQARRRNKATART